MPPKKLPKYPCGTCNKSATTNALLCNFCSMWHHATVDCIPWHSKETIDTLMEICKGPVNIYGNTGPGNLQRDHRLFLSFRHTGPPVILNVECMGPQVISMWNFNGVKDYFEVLTYGAIEFYRSLC